jgi:hypothetical protein
VFTGCAGFTTLSAIVMNAVPDSLRVTYLHLSIARDDMSVGEAWEAFTLAMVNGTNTTGIGLVQINVANATDQGDHLLCIDCGSCDEGELVRTWRCFTNFSVGNDVRSQVWALEVRGPLRAGFIPASDWSEIRPFMSTFLRFCEAALVAVQTHNRTNSAE